METEIKIKGMHCNSCSTKIETALEDYVNSVNVNYSTGIAKIDYNPNKISLEKIKSIIQELGYQISENSSNQNIKTSRTSNNFGYIIMTLSILLLLFVLYNSLNNLNLEIPSVGEKTSLFLLFIVGILTGFHCISMCGGFVVSYTTKNALKGHKGYKQHFIYATSKVISYSLIGGFFGLIGGLISFSIGLRGTIAIIAGLFMIFYALSMFGFSFFKRFQFNPKILTKITFKLSKNTRGPYLSPLVTGLLSGLFIACGPLQAMYLYAMGSGSFFSGFFSLMAFGLGTSPMLILFAGFTTKISQKTTKRILKFSAVIVLVLGLIMLNRGLIVIGSPYTFEAVKTSLFKQDLSAVSIKNGYQEIYMEVDRYGWKPDTFALKKGVPVKWKINVKELTGCNNEIIVKDYNLDFKLKKGLNIIEFIPQKVGNVYWSCWMGMIPGSFVVTDTGEVTKEQLTKSKPEKSSSSCGGSCGSPSCGAATGGSCGCGG